MNAAGLSPKRLIALLLRHSLQRGSSVEIEGLGTFLPCCGKSFRFIPQSKPRVFIAYVEEDLRNAKLLYLRLAAAGFDPWLDKKKLLPGQNWPRSIENAIESSDFFVACFSRSSVSKRGSFHSELRFALECAARVPLDEIFFIPARIEECALPGRIKNHMQYVDLYPNWEAGFNYILETMRTQVENRKRKLGL